MEEMFAMCLVAGKMGHNWVHMDTAGPYYEA